MLQTTNDYLLYSTLSGDAPLDCLLSFTLSRDTTNEYRFYRLSALICTAMLLTNICIALLCSAMLQVTIHSTDDPL